MKKKIKLYIHLGFPKTGSTFLQKFFFSKISKSNFILKEKNYSLKKLTQRILHYPLDKFKLKKEEINRIVCNINFSKHKINIISDESFTDLSTSNEKNPKDLIKKFKICFPKQKFDLYFLLVSRNQLDLLLSHYAYCYNNFLLKNLQWSTFENFISSTKEKRYKKYFNIYKYNYWRVSLFKEKVKYKFFFYETLKENPKIFFKNLSNYFGVPNMKILNKKINVSKKNEFNEISINRKYNLKNLLNNLSDLQLSFFLIKKKIITLVKRIIIFFINKTKLAKHTKQTILSIKKYYLKDNLKFIKKDNKNSKNKNLNNFSSYFFEK